MECIFCKIVEGSIPCRKIAESVNFIAFLDIAPNAEGHALLVPKKHATNLLDLPESLGNELVEFSQRVGSAVMRGTGSDGFNLILNNGKSAGQLVFHAHFHLIPRKEGDGLHFGGKHLELSSERYDVLQRQIVERFS